MHRPQRRSGQGLNVRNHMTLQGVANVCQQLRTIDSMRPWFHDSPQIGRAAVVVVAGLASQTIKLADTDTGFLCTGPDACIVRGVLVACRLDRGQNVPLE